MKGNTIELNTFEEDEVNAKQQEETYPMYQQTVEPIRTQPKQEIDNDVIMEELNDPPLLEGNFYVWTWQS